MPCSITLSDLSWSTPDGRPILSHVNLSFGAERTGLIGRNGVGKTTLVKLITGELSPSSGAVSVSGRIGVLRQSLSPSSDETIADLFGAREALALLARAQQGTAELHELADLNWMLDADIAEALARVGLNAAPDTPLAKLSGGQRTRAALAAQIHDSPDFLILDEPTNNLDREGRLAVIDVLAQWRGGAIVVSHDRALLETVDAIVELSSLGARRYGGNWSHYRECRELELQAAEHDLAYAEKRLADIRRKVQETAERKARHDKAGERKAARGDLPRIAAGGRKMRAEQTSGSNSALASRLKGQALADLKDAKDRIEVLQRLDLTLPSTRLPASKTVLRLDRIDAGYAREAPVLRNFSFDITGPERIAVTGPNGAGKTTLISVITQALQPFAGTASVAVRLAFLDQQVGLLDPGLSVRDNFLRLNPDAGENLCRSALARFMFRGDAALQPVGTLSGGQMLRAGLACVLGGPHPPELLILDEPTNHLDLDSIAAIEAGLLGYDGALLVVSHDETFLDAIGITRRLALGGL